MIVRRGPVVVLLGALTATLITGCGQIPRQTADPTPRPTPSSLSTPPPAASPIPTPTVTPTPSLTCPAEVPTGLSLKGEQGRAFAFAPVDAPETVTVEGEVDGDEAWSTSKLLVVAAFLDTTVDGDPERVSTTDRRLIAAALTRSDADAVRSLRRQIPGSAGRAMTQVLRAIGDEQTRAPDAYEGLMAWSIREQVGFMAALQDGRVVSEEASAYLMRTLRPIEEHRWGLGRVGATAFKGGWLRQGRVTRQLGLLDGYAVAIITDRGPVVRQTDGDSAHVEAMDDLAVLLARRLAYEHHCD